MLGSALYYPFMDIRDRGWLRSAILFWDDIQTIVPTTIEKPYQNPDTEICATEGYLRPLRVDLYPKLLEALSEQIMLLMSSEPDWLTNLIDSVPQGRNPSVEPLRKSRQLQKKFGKGYREPELISPSERRAMEALHRLKLGRPLQEKLRRADTKGDWVLVNSRFADLYMTALAGIFAKEKMFQL